MTNIKALEKENKNIMVQIEKWHLINEKFNRRDKQLKSNFQSAEKPKELFQNTAQRMWGKWKKRNQYGIADGTLLPSPSRKGQSHSPGSRKCRERKVSWCSCVYSKATQFGQQEKELLIVSLSEMLIDRSMEPQDSLSHIGFYRSSRGARYVGRTCLAVLHSGTRDANSFLMVSFSPWGANPFKKTKQNSKTVSQSAVRQKTNDSPLN